MRRLAPALVTMLLLAGCLGAEVAPEAPPPAVPGSGLKLDALSQPTHGVLPKLVEYVQVTIDEVQLYTEVWLPEGAGPWPTVLIMSPYNNLDRTTDPLGDVETSFREAYGPRGYAVVLTDVRGTGNSEGCMDMMGAKEQRDGFDVVEWIAAQPWSTGKIGMYGVSYVGTTPGAAAIMAPPHLTTIVPIAGVTNQWRNVYQNGVPYEGRTYPLTYEALVGAPPPRDVERGPAWLLNALAGACDQEEAILHMSPGVYEKGIYDAYWAERNFTTRAQDVQASVFYVQGFTDRAVNPMEATYWFNEIQAPKKAWLGQWPHQLPPRDDWEATLLAWFDHWLKGVDTGIMETPQVEVMTNLDTLRTDAAWPPQDAASVGLHLAPGALAAAAPAEGSESYEYRASAEGEPLPNGLAYLGEPLDAPLHMAGLPLMHLRGSVDADNTYWILEIHDVSGDAWSFVTEGWMNAHLREGFDRSAPLTPGEAYDFFFKFEPREYVFEEGHRIGLLIKGTDDAVFPFDEPRTMNTVHYGPAGSWLELPVLEDAVTFARPDGV
jgi:predicted acyl esterase